MSSMFPVMINAPSISILEISRDSLNFKEKYCGRKNIRELIEIWNTVFQRTISNNRIIFTLSEIISIMLNLNTNMRAYLITNILAL